MPPVMEQLAPGLLQIDGKVRVEIGPYKRVAIATEELLANDVTAQHYQVGMIDALNKPIVLGEEMTYLDWLGEKGWYVYKLNEETGAWEEIGFHETEAAAVMAATAALTV